MDSSLSKKGGKGRREGMRSLIRKGRRGFSATIYFTWNLSAQEMEKGGDVCNKGGFPPDGKRAPRKRGAGSILTLRKRKKEECYRWKRNRFFQKEG